MDSPDWWKENPCPLHPDWGLYDISDLDHAKLKHTIETDENANSVMVVEALIYRAFLAYPKVTGTLLKQERSKPSEARRFLQQADENIDILYARNETAKTGHRIVINTFRMWLPNDSSRLASYQSTLKNLESKKTLFPKFTSYVNVIQAYILSRLGPRFRDKAKTLYREALLDFPGNYQWLFGLALMVGREARQHRSIVGAWKGPLREELVVMFKDEEQILRKVLSIAPDFHVARAFYGQVLFNLDKRSSRADKEFREALQGDPKDRTICLMAAKYYKRKLPFLHAESMLQELIRKFNTAEINFHLGCLYSFQSHHCKNADRDSYRPKALGCFKVAMDLDNCHYPSISSCAEMNALLGNRETALEMYQDLFDSEFQDKPFLASNEFIALQYALRLTDVFKPLEYIKRSHRIIELAVTLTDDGTEVIQVPRTSLEKTQNTYLKQIERFIQRSRDPVVKREAKLQSANAKMLLKRFAEATTLYQSLYDDSKTKGEGMEVEIVFGLGKCYFKKGQMALKDGYNDRASKLWDDAIGMADELMESSNVRHSAELYADVYLAKAKAISSSPGNFKEISSDTSNPLVMAVQKGSLEGCYLYMLSHIKLKKEFFSDYKVPQTLAEVQRVCGMETPFHTQFTVTLQNGSEIVNDVDAKREFIYGAVKEVIEYHAFHGAKFTSKSLSSMTDKLKELRVNRLQYERELLQCRSSHDVGRTYIKKLSAVIQVAREILDNCVSVCQNALTTKPVSNSMFIVKFDFKTGQVKQDVCKTAVENWARKNTFPGLQLPDGFIKKIIEIQPMYDEQNLWLWAIHRINNLLKHDPSKCDLGKMYTIQLEDNSPFRSLRTDDIVKDSCSGVEALTEELIRMCFDSQAELETVTNKFRDLESSEK